MWICLLWRQAAEFCSLSPTVDSWESPDLRFGTEPRHQKCLVRDQDDRTMLTPRGQKICWLLRLAGLHRGPGLRNSVPWCASSLQLELAAVRACTQCLGDQSMICSGFHSGFLCEMMVKGVSGTYEISARPASTVTVAG